MTLVRFLALALAALLLQPAAARAASSTEMAIAWSEMPQTCDGIAGFKARFGSSTAYAGRLAALSKKLGCVKKPVVKTEPRKPKAEPKPQVVQRKQPRIVKPTPPPPPPPVNLFALGSQAEARGETQSARNYFHEACSKGDPLACNKAARSYETARLYPQTRGYDERSCQISSYADSNRKTYCANASVVYRNPVYGTADLPKAARYFLDSSTTIQEFQPKCRQDFDQCEALLNGLAAPSQVSYTKARELAVWLCSNAPNSQMAGRSCNRAVVLNGTAGYGALTLESYQQAITAARRGCTVLRDRATCTNGLFVAGSANSGVTDLALARSFFEGSGYYPNDIPCWMDWSVCHNLGYSYSTPQTFGAANYRYAVTFYTNACQGNFAQSCYNLGDLYGRTYPPTGIANPKLAQDYMAKAYSLGCSAADLCRYPKKP